jgi:hypothetical protein
MAPPLSDQGAYLLGAFFNCILFGVLSTQVYLYHLAFGKDHKYIKAIVYSIYAIELAETIIVLHCTYVAVALGWGNDAVFEKTQPIWVVPTISAIGALNMFNDSELRCFCQLCSSSNVTTRTAFGLSQGSGRYLPSSFSVRWDNLPAES